MYHTCTIRRTELKGCQPLVGFATLFNVSTIRRTFSRPHCVKGRGRVRYRTINTRLRLGPAAKKRLAVMHTRTTTIHQQLISTFNYPSGRYGLSIVVKIGS